MFYQNGSKTLLIWFGGMDEPFISQKMAIACNVDVLAVTDKFKSWYSLGFCSNHSTYQDSLEQLEKTISDGAYEKLVFCGQSSGGYAALKYALDLKPDLVIAFSPQTKNAFSGSGRMSPHIKLEDLGERYANNIETKLVFLLARSEADHEDKFRWDDWWQVAKFRNHPSSTFIDLPYHNHNISSIIRNRMNLYSFISGLLTMFIHPTF